MWAWILNLFGRPCGLAPGVKYGPYILDHRLGAGAFGEVWAARKQSEHARPWVAIKFPLNETVDEDAIAKEAGVWARGCGHPNVVPFLGCEMHGGRILLVSELAKGGSLRTWLRGFPARRPPRHEAVRLVLDMLKGLQHLHDAHITHRDIKPENTLLQGGSDRPGGGPPENVCPRLADFGLAKIAGFDPTSRAGGTRLYMAPEAFRKATPASDIWAVGVMLYEMLAGKRPFVSEAEIIQDAAPPLPPDTPPGLESVVQNALAKAEADRFRSPREMADALERTGLARADAWPEARRRAALDRYCREAIARCDLVDLHGLPVHEPHLQNQNQNLLLRNLYTPLRVWESTDAALAAEREAAQTFRERYLIDQRIEAEARRRPSAATWLATLLGTARRVVVLGHPGAGKTTFLRWLTTALMLRQTGDPTFDRFPDVGTLPADAWLPVLIRLRDLTADRVRDGTLPELVRAALDRGGLADIADDLLPLIDERLKAGTAILLLDGLDEQPPDAAAGLCRMLEDLCQSEAYRQARVVVTSRHVGYRELPHQFGRDFAEVALAALSPDEKVGFIARWCEATEPPETRAEVQADLSRAVTEVPPVARLTDTPLMLTVLAVVRRRIGTLPTRRAQLYEAAVVVLLNWKRSIGRGVNEDEAIPQLEYLAYAMCAADPPRLRMFEPEIVALWDRMRQDYPGLHQIRGHASPLDFLRELEDRTAILIQVGLDRYEGELVPVYGFWHRSFQEYMAARAIRYGRYPGCDRTSTLADRVAPLAGLVEYAENPVQVRGRTMREYVCPHLWLEVLRLCVADPNLQGADEAICRMTAGQPEDGPEVLRSRAVTAASCLIDEPSVTDDTVRHVLDAVVGATQPMDGDLRRATTLDAAVSDLGSGRWRPLVSDRLLAGASRLTGRKAQTPTGLWMHQFVPELPTGGAERGALLYSALEDLRSDAAPVAVAAALRLCHWSNDERLPAEEPLLPEVVRRLFGRLDGPPEVRRAAIRALGVLSNCVDDTKGAWVPTTADADRLRSFLAAPAVDPLDIAWATLIITASRDRTGKADLVNEWAVIADGDAAPSADTSRNPTLTAELETTLWALTASADAGVRFTAARGLARFGVRNPDLIGPLREPLTDGETTRVRQEHAAMHLAWLGATAAAPDILRLYRENGEDNGNRFICALIGMGAVPELVELLTDESESWFIRSGVAFGLVRLGDPAADRALADFAEADDRRVRLCAFVARTRLEGADDTDVRLMSVRFDGQPGWFLDRAVTPKRLADAATALGLSVEEVRARYSGLAKRFELTVG